MYCAGLQIGRSGFRRALCCVLGQSRQVEVAKQIPLAVFLSTQVVYKWVPANQTLEGEGGEGREDNPASDWHPIQGE